MDTAEEALKLLSGFKPVRCKRKTSYFSFDIEFWLDPKNEGNGIALCYYIKNNIISKFPKEKINVTLSSWSNFSGGFVNVTISDYKVLPRKDRNPWSWEPGKFEGTLYGERIEISI